MLNEYVNYDNKLSPRIVLETGEHKKIFKENESGLLEIVRNEIHEYVNDPMLCCDDEGMFPKPSMMTGEWYISNIYFVDDFLEIETHFVGIATGKKDDYLGLDVNFTYKDGKFVLNGVDSQSI